jgi:hypothetical protein
MKPWHIQNINEFTDIERISQVHEIIQGRAYKARNNIVDFFEFVMREENTQQLIKLAPHQKVGLDFIMNHDRSVNMWPVGHSKTFCVAGISLYKLGINSTTRGAIISSTQEQAMKPLRLVRQYIENNAELRAVFPQLKPSERADEPWTQHAIVIDRPYGIRDPSLCAVGLHGALPGARLNWIIIDDILTLENTSTLDQRNKVEEWIQSTVISRLDPRGAMVCVVNTAWHDDDLLHRLKKRGWPTIRMDIYGDIEVSTPPDLQLDGSYKEDMWGVNDKISNDIRPSNSSPDCTTVRLVDHDPDVKNQTPLWPERYSPVVIHEIKKNHLPHRFNNLYRNLVTNDDNARCKREYVDLCKENARKLGIYSLLDSYRNEGLVFTGVDLAVDKGESHDYTAFFTFLVLPNGYKQILDIEIEQYNGPQIVRRIIEKSRQFNSIIRVENNAAQDFIRQFTLEFDVSIPVRAHTTGRAKAHPEHGVEGLFVEMSQGAWLIPNTSTGQVSEPVQKFIDACLLYQPSTHTADVLMAAYFAREQAREWGVLNRKVSENMSPYGAIKYTR